MLTVVWLAAVIVGFFALAYVNAAGWLWTGAIALALAIAWGAHLLPPQNCTWNVATVCSPRSARSVATS